MCTVEKYAESVQKTQDSGTMGSYFDTLGKTNFQCVNSWNSVMPAKFPLSGNGSRFSYVLYWESWTLCLAPTPPPWKFFYPDNTNQCIPSRIVHVTPHIGISFFILALINQGKYWIFVRCKKLVLESFCFCPLVTFIALLIESAKAEASLRSLLVELPLASDLQYGAQ